MAVNAHPKTCADSNNSLRQALNLLQAVFFAGAAGATKVTGMFFKSLPVPDERTL
jgi:hypothetical protein